MADPPARDPVDALIARIASGEESPSEEAAAAIVRRMASAPFSRHMVRVPADDRGLSYQGRVLGRLADSCDYQPVKRVVVEQQWADGTTEAHYLAGLRAIPAHPASRLVVYDRWGIPCAAMFAATRDTVALQSRGRAWLPNVIVVYSTRHSAILTGYMFSTLDALRLPETVTWLR